MSLLRELEWRNSYRHEDGDLIELFYNPALTCAVQYDRMTGYFSADALALAARGIAALILNDGRMRLIVGCTLQQPEQDAIGEGYDWRARLETHFLAADLTPPDEEAGRGLEMLAWMVAQGHLDVKVAVPIDPDGRPAHAPGLYHEKVGILTDADGNRLSFSGSINETAGGLGQQPGELPRSLRLARRPRIGSPGRRGGRVRPALGRTRAVGEGVRFSRSGEKEAAGVSAQR